MLESVMKAVLAILAESACNFDQVEYYEGQLEVDEIRNFSIKPSCVFVEVIGSEQHPNLTSVYDEVQLRLWVTASHVRGRGDTPGVLATIDTVNGELHGTNLKHGGNKIRMELQSFRSEVFLPSLVIYSIDYIARRA